MINTTYISDIHYININKIIIQIDKYKNITLILDNNIKEQMYQVFPMDNAFAKFISTKYLENNNNIKGTTIDLGIAENILKEAYYIPYNDSIYILIIDVNQEGMKIPKVEYAVFYLDDENNLKQLHLSICKNVKIEVSIPVEINDIIDKYNSSSGYYNDLCYTLTSQYGTDICLKDRKNEFIDNNLTLCEENCELISYDYYYKRGKMFI